MAIALSPLSNGRNVFFVALEISPMIYVASCVRRSPYVGVENAVVCSVKSMIWWDCPLADLLQSLGLLRQSRSHCTGEPLYKCSPHVDIFSSNDCLKLAIHMVDLTDICIELSGVLPRGSRCIQAESVLVYRIHGCHTGAVYPLAG